MLIAHYYNSSKRLKSYPITSGWIRWRTTEEFFVIIVTYLYYMKVRKSYKFHRET